MKQHWQLYLGVSLLALIILFVVQNMASVTVNFLFWKFSASRALMLLLVLVIGFAIGWFTRGWWLHRRLH